MKNKINLMKKNRNIEDIFINWGKWEWIFENNKWFLNLSNRIEVNTWKNIMVKYWLNENDIFLEKIETTKPNKWYGNDLLNELINYAKANNKNILLKARAEKRISQKNLENWYKRKNFKFISEFQEYWESIMFLKLKKDI